MIFGLKLLSLGLQAYIVGIILFQFRHPSYQFYRWKIAWGALFVSGCFMASRRVYDFWNPVSVWSVLFPLAVSVSMLVGLRQLSIIFHSHVELAKTTDPACVTIDGFSTIVAWNEQATRLFGWSTQAALGQTLMQTIIPPRDWEAHREGVTRFLATGHEGRVIDRMFAVNAMHKSGSELPVEIRVTSIVQADGTFRFVASIRELGLM